MSRMLKKTLDSLLTPKESDELISAFKYVSFGELTNQELGDKYLLYKK